MYHDVRTVAANRFFDPDMFYEFAKTNKEKFSVIGEELLIIGTYYLDDLCQGFKASLGNDFEAHREEQIALRQARRPGAL